MELSSVNEDFILRELEKLNDSKSTGLDSIPSRFLKDGAQVLAKPITFLINLSLTSGIEPNEVKQARVYQHLNELRSIFPFPVIALAATSTEESKTLVVWILLFSFGAACAEGLHGEALNSSAELGLPLHLRCSIPSSMDKNKNFRWAVDKIFHKADEANQTQSIFIIEKITEDFLVNTSVKCYYGPELLYTFDSRFFMDIFHYIPEPEEKSMSYIYNPGSNSIRFDVKFEKIFPKPSCKLFTKPMNEDFSLEGLFYSGSYSIEWPLKIFRCLDLHPLCHLNNLTIPNGPLKIGCHEALKQSYRDSMLTFALYIIIPIVILICVKINYRGEDNTGNLDWNLSTKIQYLSAFSALLGNPFLLGYNLAVLNNPAVVIALSVMKDRGSTSEMDINEEFDKSVKFNFLWSLGVDLYVFSGFIGVLIARKIAMAYGRKRTLMMNSLMMVLASVIGFLITLADESIYRIWLFYTHRIFIGFSCGIGLITSGMYTMEISRLTLNSVKGSFGTYDRWFHFYITGGIVVSTLLGTRCLFGNVERWHWLLVLNFIPALFNIFLYWCPESPIYVYIRTGKPELMEKELCKICTQDELVDKSRRVIQMAEHLENLQFTSVLKLIQCMRNRVQLIVVCFLQAAQQLSGVNVIVAFSSFIYRYAGVQSELAEWIVFGTALTNCISTFITLSSKQKRRKLLMISTLFMVFALFVQLVTSNLCESFQEACPFFAVTAVSIYVVAFSLGLGPIPYIVVQEMFDEKDQSAAFTISMAVNWITSFVVLFLFRILQLYLQSYIYALYMGVVLVLLFLIHKGVPETLENLGGLENSAEYKFVENMCCNKDNENGQQDQMIELNHD